MATDLEILRTNLMKLRRSDQDNFAVFLETVEQGKVCVKEGLIKAKREVAERLLCQTEKGDLILGNELSAKGMFNLR